MDPNPYEAPKEKEEGHDQPMSDKPEDRQKPWWGYFMAIIVGAIVGGALPGLPLAIFDDSGGLQLVIGAFLGLVIYGLLF